MATHRPAPLLALDDNDPASLSGPPNRAVEEESALSRLISESTPPTALTPFSAAVDETNLSDTAAVEHLPASFTTILAGTFITLQWGFTWGAYFSQSWMDIHMEILIGWQEKYLPWFTHHTDVVLQGMSVFTLSDNLKEDKEYGSLAGIWFCSVVLPSVFMVVCPIWILSDSGAPPRRRQNRMFPLGQPWSRLWLELMIRLSWLAAFIHMTLNVAISGIELQWTDTNLRVHNAFKGPYISYLLGCTCALLCVVVLRMPHLEHLKLLGYPGQDKPKRNPRHVQAGAPEPTPPPATQAPPATAFSLPWLSSFSQDDEQDEANNQAQQPLLGSPHSRTPKQPIPIWKHFCMFQLALLSVVMWFPALALPQFRVLYSGLIMEMIKVPAYNVYVWQLPTILWHSGIRASTPAWILVMVFVLVGTFAIFLPLVALGMACKTWYQHYQQRDSYGSKWRDALILLHPLLCGVPFAAGLIVTVPAFEDIGENIDDDICIQIEKVVQDQCLISGGVVQWGAYFLLAQAVAVEGLVVLALWWTAPPRPPMITV